MLPGHAKCSCVCVNCNKVTIYMHTYVSTVHMTLCSVYAFVQYMCIVYVSYNGIATQWCCSVTLNLICLSILFIYARV